VNDTQAMICAAHSSSHNARTTHNEIGAAIHDRSDGSIAGRHVDKAAQPHHALDALQVPTQSVLRM